MNPYEAYTRIEAVARPEMAHAMWAILGDMYAELKNTPTREDFSDLRTIVGELAGSQIETQRELRQLDRQVEVVMIDYGEMDVLRIVISHFAQSDAIKVLERHDIHVIQSFEW